MQKRALFLCTANSCRSQMAEEIVNHFLSDHIIAFSAGTEASSINPRSIAVLQENGIDISQHRSKSLAEFDNEIFDYVITLCNCANDRCPLFFGGIKRIHIGFDDPAKANGREEAIMAEFRRVRNEIKNILLEFFSNE